MALEVPSPVPTTTPRTEIAVSTVGRQKKLNLLTGVCPSVYSLVIRTRLLSCKTQKSRQILWRLNLLQVVVKVKNRI